VTSSGSSSRRHACCLGAQSLVLDLTSAECLHKQFGGVVSVEIEERFARFGCAEASFEDKVQGSLTVLVSHVRMCPMLQEKASYYFSPFMTRVMERGAAATVPCVHVRAMLQKEENDFFMSWSARPVEGCTAIIVQCIHIDFMFQQAADGLCEAMLTYCVEQLLEVLECWAGKHFSHFSLL